MRHGTVTVGGLIFHMRDHSGTTTATGSVSR
jgi:hypothetical protein